ncbi:hypothetical protein CAI21_04270 [Alkalilimnicola ehrlichii]|uniref:PilZ domain-containing protein n=1 Tax=Alkalilimnicola ehrlichii TaxID=351052 RepID=A0A3E0WZ46_9GAMM|nr:PilZ domain-containing protein [Alkalilimnicola ehrlichii]RFA30730.1 hypothetical protein CAI21_04270 [Alkalilimnicola ehrlichii]RFA38306.1 hypothetical protein CAL65_05635 [Alkalilimnicola ehrlichii]
MRRERRFHYMHMRNIKVSNSLSGDPMGVVGDLSPKGLRLIGKQPLAIGACYEMRLHSTDKDGNTEHVDVKMICRWVKKDPERSIYQIGFELDQASKAFTDLVSRTLVRRGPVAIQR